MSPSGLGTTEFSRCATPAFRTRMPPERRPRPEAQEASHVPTSRTDPRRRSDPHHATRSRGGPPGGAGASGSQALDEGPAPTDRACRSGSCDGWSIGWWPLDRDRTPRGAGYACRHGRTRQQPRVRRPARRARNDRSGAGSRAGGRIRPCACRGRGRGRQDTVHGRSGAHRAWAWLSGPAGRVRQRRRLQPAVWPARRGPPRAGQRPGSVGDRDARRAGSRGSRPSGPGLRLDRHHGSGPVRVGPVTPLRRAPRALDPTLGAIAGPPRPRGPPLGGRGHARDDRVPRPGPRERARGADRDISDRRAPSTPSAAAVARRAGAGRSRPTRRASPDSISRASRP